MNSRARIRLGSIALIGVILLAGCMGFLSQESEVAQPNDTDSTAQQHNVQLNTQTEDATNITAHSEETGTSGDASIDTREATPATTSSDEPVDWATAETTSETTVKTKTVTEAQADSNSQIATTTETETESTESERPPNNLRGTSTSQRPTTVAETETETETTTDESRPLEHMFTVVNKSQVYDTYDEDESGTIDLDEVTVVNNNDGYPVRGWEEACSYNTYYEYWAHGGSSSIGDVNGNDSSAMPLPNSEPVTAAEWCGLNERAANGENVTAATMGDDND